MGGSCPDTIGREISPPGLMRRDAVHRLMIWRMSFPLFFGVGAMRFVNNELLFDLVQGHT